MTTKGVSMRKLKELLRLHFDLKLSQHKIAQTLNLSSGVVNKYLKRVLASKINWPLPTELEDEKVLEAFLKSKSSSLSSLSPLSSFAPQSPATEWNQCDFAIIHKEMKRKGVTLQLLHEELSQGCNADDFISYSHFALLYRTWKDKLPQSMRQVHKTGDKVFIDYAGQKVTITDHYTGKTQKAEIFIGVLGSSNYTYVEATWSQQLADWISSQQRMFEFFGGVPALVVPDNLRSAVTKSCRYEPDINQTYAKFIEHYGTAVMPARPYKPRDKAKVEVGVQIVERWILARLRHRVFTNLGELNIAIRECLNWFNMHPFKHLPGSRQDAFLLEKPLLRPLPTAPYVLQYYKKARVNIDYHFELDGHYYSVPYNYCKEQVELWYTQDFISCYLNGKCIARHERSYKVGTHTTILEHMPKSHQKHLEWTPGRFMNWGKNIGPSTLKLVTHLLENRPHPEQGYRSCLGLLSLEKKYGKKRLESACLCAIQLGTKSRRSVASILKSNLDLYQLKEEPTRFLLPNNHENLRGAHYYKVLVNRKAMGLNDQLSASQVLAKVTSK
jgi:transposase